MARDAISLITQDHRRIEQLLQRLEFERGDRGTPLAELAARLVAHSHAEEEIVYPAVAQSGARDPAEVRQAENEHHHAEDLLHRLQGMRPDDAEFDRMLQRLADAVGRHVEEEEKTVLPALKGAVDRKRLEELGRAFAERRDEEMRRAGVGAGKGPGELVGSDEAELMDKSRDELYEEARRVGVKGRSRMSKDQLAHALAQQRQGRH